MLETEGKLELVSLENTQPEKQSLPLSRRAVLSLTVGSSGPEVFRVENLQDTQTFTC